MSEDLSPGPRQEEGGSDARLLSPSLPWDGGWGLGPSPAAIPRSPCNPVPRMSRCSTVSAWSSAVWPVAIHCAPTSAATSAKNS